MCPGDNFALISQKQKTWYYELNFESRDSRDLL